MIRRDILKFTGGAAAGLVFTPVPWRLLGDSAIWSQNWAWMPRVPRGEVTERNARCTMCPAGCAVKLRSVGTLPTGLWPRESAMCPAGFVAHHMAWHTLRLRTVLQDGRPGSLDAALSSIKEQAHGGSAAVLDLLPHRTASRLHRMHMQKLGGRYLTPPPIEGATAAAVAKLLQKPGSLAVDLAAVETVLSLSTPLLDGWAAPARTVGRQFRLIQAEARRSRTAGSADRWLAIRPGSESALLLGLLHCVLRGNNPERWAMLEGFATLAASAAIMTPSAAEQYTGVPAAVIEKTAAELAATRAVVIADGDPVGGPLGVEAQSLAAALNVLLGLHGMRRRPDIPAPQEWAGVEETALSAAEDGSIHLLLIDEPQPGLAVPWSLIEPKLAPGATVVALTWSQASWAGKAQWMVPCPTFLETPQDTAPEHDAADARWQVSPALLPAPRGTLHAAEFVGRLAGDDTPFAQRVSELIRALGADEKELLENGGSWRSAAVPAVAGPARAVLPESMTASRLSAASMRASGAIQVVGYGWRQAAVSPLLGKLWQESELRDSPRDASAHPDTLRHFELADGAAAVVQAAQGSLSVRMSSDASLPDGLVALSSGPAFAQICRPDSSGAWRTGGVKVVRA